MPYGMLLLVPESSFCNSLLFIPDVTLSKDHCLVLKTVAARSPLRLGMIGSNCSACPTCARQMHVLGEVGRILWTLKDNEARFWERCGCIELPERGIATWMELHAPLLPLACSMSRLHSRSSWYDEPLWHAKDQIHGVSSALIHGLG